jgi:hypothetical protein
MEQAFFEKKFVTRVVGKECWAEIFALNAKAMASCEWVAWFA